MGPQPPCQRHAQSFVKDPGVFCPMERRDVGESNLSHNTGRSTENESSTVIPDKGSR